MKRVLSLILSLILTVTAISSSSLCLYAGDEKAIGLDSNFTFSASYSENESKALTLDSTYTFTSSETEYYSVSIISTDNENLNDISFSFVATNDYSVLSVDNYFCLVEGIKYKLVVTYTGTNDISDVSGSVTAKLNKAENSHADKYLYSLNEQNEIVIRAYNAGERNVTVPDELLGYPVCEIGMGAFGIGGTNAESITVPKSVSKIDFWAFGASKNAKITIENPECKIETQYDSESVSFENGKSTGVTIQMMLSVLSTFYSSLTGIDITEEDIKNVIESDIFDTNENGEVILWTIKPSSTLVSAHTSNAEKYADTYGNSFIGTDEHELVTNRNEPTCVAAGSEVKSCKNCDYEETNYISPTGKHDYILKETIKPTCTAEGYSIYECSVCHNEIQKDFVEKTDHTIVVDDGVSATCTRNGRTRRLRCSVCKKVVEESKVIPAYGHIKVVDKAVPATFTSKGKTAGIHCSECGVILKAQKTVAKLGSPSLSKVNKSNKAFKASWKSVKSIDGYQIQYATNKKFTKNKAVVNVKGASKKAKTVSKLKAKTKYYVRIRAYKTINGKKQYSKWSKKKTVKL